MKIVFIIKKYLMAGTIFLNKTGIGPKNGRKPNPFTVGVRGLTTLLALCFGLLGQGLLNPRGLNASFS